MDAQLSEEGAQGDGAPPIAAIRSVTAAAGELDLTQTLIENAYEEAERRSVVALGDRPWQGESDSEWKAGRDEVGLDVDRDDDGVVGKFVSAPAPGGGTFVGSEPRHANEGCPLHEAETRRNALEGMTR